MSGQESTKPLHLNEIFWTFQGEGYHAGRRSLFVRMPFCNYSCPWCDTEYNTYDKYSEEDFITFAQREPAKFAVITGGEPMMNKHTPRVIEILKKLGYELACETNGSKEILDGIDFCTVSPKKYVQKGTEPYFINPNAFAKADEFKYVVDHEFDLSVLDRHDTKDGRRYSLSPEFNRMDESLQRIFAYIKENPEWKISLQTHKWIGVR